MGMEDLLAEKKLKKRTVTLQDHARGRERARKLYPGYFYLGTDLERGDPLYLSDELRTQHIHLVGGSGSGKTSFIQSMIFHDLQRGRGLVFIDGKGDIKTLRDIYGIVKFLGREKDFRFLSLAHPEISNTYSPLVNGTATQIKDKLIGSILWSEPYYRKTSELATQTLMRAIYDAGMRCTFEDLDLLLTSKESIHALSKLAKSRIVARKLEQYQNDFDKNLRDLRGFSTDINLLINSEFGELFNTVNPEIDFIRAYQNSEIIYLAINKRGLSETAERLGRMILKDLAFASDHFDTKVDPVERRIFPVFVDEVDAFVYDYFIDFAAQARSSGFALLLGHHSLSGDLQQFGKGFLNRLVDNINTSIFMRQRSNESVEQCSNISGTKKVASESYQTEDKNALLGMKKALTGFGNIYVENQYHLDPNLIRTLQTGEAYVIVSEPVLRHLVKLNYVPPVPWEGVLEKMKADIPEKYTRIPLSLDGPPDYKTAQVKKEQVR